MGDAKRIRVEPITAQDANRIIRSLHYSGKIVQNSCLHLGVFLDGQCGGALSFGPSLDKRKMIGLVEGTGWNEFLELNRMALADWLPRNGESRVLSVAMRLIRKHYPHVKWILSFSDACECGDGTIYRAAGFVLTGIKKNDNIWIAPDGRKVHKMTIESNRRLMARYGRWQKARDAVYGPCKKLDGFQLRYLYFLHPDCRERLTVPILPYEEIDRRGAGMYRGNKRVRSIDSDATGDQPEEGGASPTRTLAGGGA